jgi:hypothetical protein
MIEAWNIWEESFENLDDDPRERNWDLEFSNVRE